MTDFSKKCQLLGELYKEHRRDADFLYFVEMNDLGLPLAYFANEGLSILTEESNKYIMSTWSALMRLIQVDEDTEYETLDEILYDFRILE
jgi:hypothetical protein